MKRFPLKQRLLAGGLALTGLALVIPANAAIETIPGTICDSVYPANDASYGTNLYKEFSGLRNGSSGFRYVFCPLHRSNGGTTTGLSSVYVAVDDSTGTQWCHAQSVDEFGNLIASQTRTIPSAGNNRLLAFPGLASVPWGRYQVFCTMPVGSVIHTVEYVEN
jgi:hypothetical protein